MSDDFERKFLVLREKYSRKMSALADRLGVTSNYISQVAGGRTPGKQFVAGVRMLYQLEIEQKPDDQQLRDNVAMVMHELAEKYRSAKESAEIVGSDELRNYLGIAPQTEKKPGDASAS